MDEHNHEHHQHHEHAHDAHHHTEHKTTSAKLPAYSKLTQLENWLEEYLGQKAPQLPQVWRENIAKFSPWITLVILVLTLPVILAVFGLTSFILSHAARYGYYHHGGWDIFVLLIIAASLVLEVMALPGLFKRQKQGWVLLFYAVLVTTAAHILSFELGALLGSIIGLYILFQIKNQYH